MFPKNGTHLGLFGALPSLSMMVASAKGVQL